MQAVILAAGMGRRLKSLTADNTKCMIEVNGVSLIDRMLAQLDGLGLDRIVIVVGYQAKKLIDHIATLDVKTPIEYVENRVYDRTNNIYSLSLAKSQLAEDDTLLLESDLIFEDGILEDLLADPRPSLALVAKYESWMYGTVVKLEKDDRISRFVAPKKLKFNQLDEYFKTVNIYKFSRDFLRNHYLPFLEAYTIALGNNEVYEQVLRVITMVDDTELRARRLEGQLWYEIDDAQDLDIAESMFAPTQAAKLRMHQIRYGGYWRYPNLLDFCYLVNPFYPPVRLIEEMKANFSILVSQYPSGMRVNAMLAAKTFDVEESHVVVGNGAAELIKSLMEGMTGKVGFVRPTFEEYPNRYDPEKSIAFTPDNDDFSYTADDLMAFFTGKGLEALVLINPDNPSGNYLPKDDVLRLMQWAEDEGVRLVYDESFSDFSDELDNTFMDDELLNRFPHMCVMKSISKSYGVPGVRLGLLLSADEDLIAHTKKDIGIWNVNSFGEFYLQIAEKYLGEYAAGLAKFRKSRRKFVAALKDVEGIRVIPSQANYLMIEILGGKSATTLTEKLLCEHDILIKDLSKKIVRGDKQYIRVAVRNDADNKQLVKGLVQVLSEI